MTEPLNQTDINALASQVERLSNIFGTLSEMITNQEARLTSIDTALRDRLKPFVERLDGIFSSTTSEENAIFKTLKKFDSKIGEMSAEVDMILAEIINSPPVSEEFDKIDQAIETAETINETLMGQLISLEALVEEAEEQVLDAILSLKEQSEDLAEELLEILSSDTSDFANTLTDEVFAPIHTALESLTEKLSESVTEQVETVIDGQIARIAGEVATALDAALELLRRSMEELLDNLTEQLELDTNSERSGRETLEEALGPLEAALDILRTAYGVFQSIAGTVGVSLPDLD